MVAPEFFGQRVKSLRREMGLTQDELARRVGCAPVTLRKIEYDDLRPSVQIAERLAMALNIPLEERPDFVRQARLERTALSEPAPTPSPKLEEIGFEDLSGRTIRGYALGERIGTGGMGVVYRAVQPLVEREVAVKIILPQYANHPEFIRRFEAEAQLVARLEHPHIVPLYDYWREPNVAYLVMRLLRGGSLQKLLEEGPLPLDLTLRVMEQIGSALSTAHRAGVIHRDLKPANILLDEDQNAYLADFGIAKNLGNPNQADTTQSDNISESPAYVSPEQIRSEFVRLQSDIYCLGVVLYEMLTGRTPFQGPTPLDILHQHLSTHLPPLAVHKIGLPRTLDAVIEHATAKDPLARYPDVESLLVDLRRAMRGQEITFTELVTTLEQPPLMAADNPYKGLRAFVEGDAVDFFGREALIQQLLVRMGEGGDLSRLLLVVGPSGSGKSSVVKAGLIPSLRRGALPGSESWYIVDLLPGSHPFEEIESALLRIAVNPPDMLLEQLKQDKRGLLHAVQSCLPDGSHEADGAPIKLVLVIDQFEELFTLVEDEAERSLFLDSLATAVLDERSPLRVVLTLRADFTDRPLQYVDFGEICCQRMEIVLPMTPDELEQAIVRPAERVGLQIEPDLVAAIVRDVEGQPGALPLMEYALTELFDLRDERLLIKAAYDRIGGVLGALGRRAEEGYATLDESGKEATRQLFLRLVTLGEGMEDTRRRVARTELDTLQNAIPDIANQPSTISQVVEAFGRARLLSFDRDPITRGPTLEVAHEALLHEWPRLRGWLADSREDVRMQRLLAGEVGEWLHGGRDPSFLLSGARLTQFEAWAEGSAVALTQDERAYLDASLQARQHQQDEEQARQQRELEAARQVSVSARRLAHTQRQRSLVLTAGLLIAITLGLLSFIFYRQSNQNLTTARAANTQVVAIVATAQANADVAVGRQALAQALVLPLDTERNNIRSGLLLVESLRRAPGVDSVNMAHQVLSGLLHPVATMAHDHFVYAVAFSPDGKWVVSGSQDGTARVWDSVTGVEISKMTYGGSVLDVAFSPDGRRVVSGSQDGTACVWWADSGIEIARMKHQGSVRAVAFSPDGKRVVSGSADHTARVWDAENGNEIARKEHDDDVLAVAFSPQTGYSVVSGSYDGTLVLWKATTGEEFFHVKHDAAVTAVALARREVGLYVVSGSADGTARVWLSRPGQEGKEVARMKHNRNVTDVEISPDGKRIVSASLDGAVLVWEADSGNEIARMKHADGVYAVAYSPDGHWVVSAGADGSARVWEVSSSTQVAYLAHKGLVAAVAFNPAGDRIATGGADNVVNVWRVTSGIEVARMIHDQAVYYLAFSPDGRWLASGGFEGGTATVWEAATGQKVAQFYSGRLPIDVAFSPDSRWLATTGLYSAQVWDVASNTEIMNIHLPLDGSRVAFSPDGRFLVAGTWGDSIMATSGHPGVLEVWDLVTKKRVTQMSHDDSVYSLAFSPDGKWIISGSEDNTARVWETATGREVSRMPHTSRVAAVDFGPDGMRVVSASADGVVIWDPATGKEIARGKNPIGVYMVDFSPDGQWVVSAGFDGTARVWRADTGEEVSRVDHGGIVEAVAFSPDGRYVASGGHDNMTRVWEAATGREITRMAHDGIVYAVAFSPDGHWIASGSDDKTVRVWIWQPEDIADLLCSRLPRNFTQEEWRQFFGDAEYHQTCENLPVGK